MIRKSTSLAAAFLLLGLAPALAATSRTFVSSSGLDTNPCSITQPCRTLQAAVTATAPAGEVVILTPGGYGTVTITQSITIANDGVGTASISVPQNGTGITINAGTNDVVQLRGLEIDGNSGGGNSIGAFGITINGGAVDILNCVIANNYGAGVNSGMSSPLTISKSVFSNNGVGIDTEGTSSGGGVNLSVENSLVIDSFNIGIIADSGGNGQVIIKKTTVARSRTYGMQILGSSGFLVDNSIINNPQIGILIAGQCTAYLDGNTITSNGTGVEVDPSIQYQQTKAFSFQNNNISKNSTNINGTLTPAAGQ